MSDPNKFINTYIDTTMAALHEYLGSNLQLKTQLKLANDLLQERDQTIANMTIEIENIKNAAINSDSDVNSVRAELVAAQDKLKTAEDSHNAMKNKLSHMDTLTKQLTDMKNEIKIRDDRIAAYAEELDTKEAQISSLKNAIAELKKQTTAVKSTNVDKVVKESSTVKVQLNTKSKPKELPIDDDF